MENLRCSHLKTMGANYKSWRGLKRKIINKICGGFRGLLVTSGIHANTKGGGGGRGKKKKGI